MSNQVLDDLKNNVAVINEEINISKKENFICGESLPDFMFTRFVNRLDPIEYCQNILRNHLPESKKYLHSNQVGLVRAACNPKIRQVAALMARQAGKCFGRGTKILMADRSVKEVQDIVPGDQVLAANGKVSTVGTVTHDSGVLYRIHRGEGEFVNRYDKLVVNDVHILVLVVAGQRELVTMTMSEYVNLPKDEQAKYKMLCGRPQNIGELPANLTIKHVGGLESLKPAFKFERERIVSIDDKLELSALLADLKLHNINTRWFQLSDEHQSINYTRGFNPNRKQTESGELIHVSDAHSFTYENIGNGEYFGFTIVDGANDKLFMLADTTIVHNTESISSICGYLLDNYPQMRIGIFTPRVQQAEIDVGRLSTFFQMNEELLNHKIVKLNKARIEMSNGSYVSAVSASDQSNIEGLTFDVIILDEAQKVSDYTWSERIAPMGGACVRGDSLVLLPDGSQVRIDKLVTERSVREVVAVDPNTFKFTTAKVVNYVDSGVQLTRIMYTRSGRMIVGTVHHPVLVDDGSGPRWIRMRDIQVGQRAISVNIVNGQPSMFADEVVDISNNPPQHVYDLTVEGIHNFVANGVVVHNTNAKIIKVGTPKTRNHFYECIEGKASENWKVIKRDWTQCEQLWALDAIMLPDIKTGEVRPYSRFVLEKQMPKALKQEFFPNNPEVWTEGGMDIEDFKTQYMLEFIDGAGKYLINSQVDSLKSGDFDWLEHGIIGERYVAGIDFAGSNPQGDCTHITVLRVNPDGVKHKVFALEFANTSYPEQMYEIAKLFGGYSPMFEVTKIFADYTGCGAAIVQTLQQEFGLNQLEGIIFNSSDRFTNSGMNMKNIMYAKFRQELDSGKFKYMTSENFIKSNTVSSGLGNVGFYHKMIGEWADLESTTMHTINKKIEAPNGYHDDACDADVLANFTTIAGQRRSMPRPVRASTWRRW